MPRSKEPSRRFQIQVLSIQMQQQFRKQVILEFQVFNGPLFSKLSSGDLILIYRPIGIVIYVYIYNIYLELI